MKRENNFDRLFKHIIEDIYCYHSCDKLRYNSDYYTIEYHNTLMAMKYSIFDKATYQWYDVIIVTSENWKAIPNWKRVKKRLVEKAIENEFIVVFADYMDIGFGINETEIDVYDRFNQMVKIAMEFKVKNVVAKTLYDPIIFDNEDDDTLELPYQTVYTFDQFCGNAATIISIVTNDQRDGSIFSLLEPKYNEYVEYINSAIRRIMYLKPTKLDTNTMQIENDIYCRKLCNNKNKPLALIRTRIDKLENKLNKETIKNDN